jgi:hypothetical protein
MKLHLTVGSAALALVLGGATSMAQTQVTWGARIDNGVGTAAGQPLPLSDAVLVGTFDISNSTIAANATNYTFLLSHWTQFANSTIGAGSPNGAGDNSGYWLSTNTNSTIVLGIATKPIYYWVFNSATPALASQYGIFTGSTSTNSTISNAWTFPSDTDVVHATNTDLDNVPHNSTGIIVGSFGTGISADGSSPLYNLAVIPEPGSAVLLVCGASFILAVRRRRRLG